MAHVSSSFRGSVASHLAAGRLETLRQKPELLAPGESRFALDEEASGSLPGAEARQIVRGLASGLYRVEVQVSWLPGPGSTSKGASRW